MIDIAIDPDVFNSSSPKYRPAMAGLAHIAQVPVEADSMTMASSIFLPRNTDAERNVNANSNRTIYITSNPRQLDEEYFKHGETGLIGPFMFNLARKVDDGLLRVRRISGTTATVVTGKQIIEYATTGTWA